MTYDDGGYQRKRRRVIGRGGPGMTVVPSSLGKKGEASTVFIQRRFDIYPMMLAKDRSDQIFSRAYVMPSHHLSLILSLTGDITNNQ